MPLLFDSFWRAAAYCLYPRVIALSLLPLVIMVLISGVLGYFYWDPAVATVAAWLDSSNWWSLLSGWLARLGVGDLRNGLAPLLLVLGLTPLVVVFALLLVALLLAPAVLRLVAERRFPTLERRGPDSVLGSLLWSLGHTVVALIALGLSLPLWLVPPLILVVPPLIWGWLTCRVLAFDVLAVHASADERRALLATHRWPLLGMGLVAGYLGAAPTLLWAMGVLTLVFAPLLVLVSVWLYTLVFAFTALWFAHYALAALQAWRGEHEVEVLPAEAASAPAQALPPPGADTALPRALP